MQTLAVREVLLQRISFLAVLFLQKGALGAPALVLAVAALVILVVFGGARRNATDSSVFQLFSNHVGAFAWNALLGFHPCIGLYTP